MSMTFSIAAAERRAYTVPETGETHTYSVSDDVEDGLAMNLANANARNLLATVGLELDDAGEVPAERVSDVLRATLLALNTRAGRSGLVRPAYESHEPGHAHVYDAGTDEDYAVRRLTQFATLLKRAADLRRAIVWG